MKIILALIFVILIQGCSTTPVAIAPAKRLMGFQEPKKSAIVVTRDSGSYGSGCYMGLRINDTNAARLDPGELARFYVDPGKVTLNIGGDPMGRFLCSRKGNGLSRDITIEENEVLLFRLYMDTSGLNIDSANP